MMSNFSIWSFTPNGNLPASAGSGLVAPKSRRKSDRSPLIHLRQTMQYCSDEKTEANKIAVVKVAGFKNIFVR